MIQAELSILESAIGYRFSNRGLLVTALTHSSYANEHHQKKGDDNERLEFLGDAVLELVTSDFLYHKYPYKAEGELTKLRAGLVCEQGLADIAIPLGLPDFIRLGNGEEKTGGRFRKSIISDAMEALIGAVYLDGGMQAPNDMIVSLMLQDIEHRLLFQDAKTALQELLQAKEMTATYCLIKESGPDHCKEFTVEVKTDEIVIGTGVGHTKKEAQQAAAREALKRIKNVS